MSTRAVIQLTDLHLTPERGAELCGVDTEATFTATLDAALAEGPADAVLVTGDIAHDPTGPAPYERFLDIVRQRHSGVLACVPGNHDLIASMLLAGMPMENVDLGGWRIALLDSHVDDVPGAEVADVQVDRLAADIADAGHVLVATHHPLFEVGCPWLDCDRIRSARLLEYLSSNVAVRAVTAGHVHQEMQWLHAETAFYTTPSTCFQFEPNTHAPTLNQRPPGWRRFELHEDGRIDTHVRRVKGLSVSPVFKF